MLLACHIDASYLSETGARSRDGGHFFLSSNAEMPANNGAVLNIARIIKAVIASAAEAEIGAMYINAREAVPQRMTLSEMGHPHPRMFAWGGTGTFLYYARAVYSTLLVALSALASEQAIPTEKTMEKVMTFLDYAASR